MTNTTSKNDVMGVKNPITNTHNNIDDLSFFDFAVEKRPLFFESDYNSDSAVMTQIDGKHAVVRADTNQC